MGLRGGRGGRPWLYVLAIAALVPVLAGLLLLALTRPAPAYPPLDIPLREQLSHARTLMETLGPGLAREGEVRTLRLSRTDLDIGLNLALERRALGPARSRLGDDGLDISASLRIPGLPLRRYLDVDLRLAPRDKHLVPARLVLGGLTLPEPWAGRLLSMAVDLSPYRRHVRASLAMIQEVNLEPRRDGAFQLAVTLRWQAAALRQALGGKKLGLAGVDQAHLALYRNRLDQVKGPDFHAAMSALFQLAQARAEASDPVIENRAALVVLTESALGRRLFPEAARPPGKRAWRLDGRQDLVQHFALSALMAALAGHELADLAGLYKEIQDTARGGSGFSFTDLAAGKAGTRLGEAAIQSPLAARQLQQGLARAETSRDYFPALADLPEFMSQKEFSRRFGGVGAPAYQAVMADIESRIAALPLYRPEGSGAR